MTWDKDTVRAEHFRAEGNLVIIKDSVSSYMSETWFKLSQAINLMSGNLLKRKWLYWSKSLTRKERTVLSTVINCTLQQHAPSTGGLGWQCALLLLPQTHPSTCTGTPLGPLKPSLWQISFLLHLNPPAPRESIERSDLRTSLAHTYPVLTLCQTCLVQ